MKIFDVSVPPVYLYLPLIIIGSIALLVILIVVSVKIIKNRRGY
jgi:hypothetical protein